jgi:hypothetical protein
MGTSNFPRLRVKENAYTQQPVNDHLGGEVARQVMSLSDCTVMNHENRNGRIREGGGVWWRYRRRMLIGRGKSY